MFVEYTTTITHRIEFGDEGITDISHAVDVSAGEASVLPESLLYAITKAGCEATIKSIDAGKAERVVAGGDDDDD